MVIAATAGNGETEMPLIKPVIRSSGHPARSVTDVAVGARTRHPAGGPPSGGHEGHEATARGHQVSEVEVTRGAEDTDTEWRDLMMSEVRHVKVLTCRGVEVLGVWQKTPQ